MYHKSQKYIQSKIPISNAIHMIQTVAELGYAGLKAFMLTREDPKILENSFDIEQETYDEFIKRLSTACWIIINKNLKIKSKLKL